MTGARGTTSTRRTCVRRCTVRGPAARAACALLTDLAVTAQEFSEAKTIILDLLGWGVPSEYLLRCGLGRESIYYTFTELNLRYGVFPGCFSFLTFCV